MPLSMHRRTSENPYVFVVGCPRSGTTLLQRMLDNHPHLAVANDTHFIPRAVKHLSGETNPSLDDDLVERVKTYRRFSRLGLTDGEVEEAAGGAHSYRAFVSNLYAAYARKHGKRWAGEKTPDYCRHLPFLSELFPRARFVHIIRDGRDVTLSTLQWAHEEKGPGRWTLWPEEPVGTCALWWRWQVSQGREGGVCLGADSYLEVPYEDLVARSETTLHDIATFLELPYSSEMLAYHEGKTRYAPELSAKSAWLPPTQGLRDWRTQMAERDVALFESLAGDLLSSLGYPLAAETTSQAIEATAEKCRQWWIAHKGKPGRRRKASEADGRSTASLM